MSATMEQQTAADPGAWEPSIIPDRWLFVNVYYVTRMDLWVSHLGGAPGFRCLLRGGAVGGSANVDIG